MANVKNNFRIKWGIYLIILLSCSTSCVTMVAPRNMYAVQGVNAPMFTEKKQTYVDMNLSYHGLDAYGSYALGNHLALSGSWYWRREIHYDKDYHHVRHAPPRMDSVHSKRELISLGMIYYAPLNKAKRYFINVSSGYGTGRFSMKSVAKTKTHLAGSDSLITTNEPFYYDAHTSRFFVQPAFISNKPRFKSSISVRWTGMVYNHLQNTPHPDKYGKVSHKLLSFIEPAYTCKFFVTDWLHLTLQAGASLNTQEIDYQYSSVIGNIGIGIDPVKLFSHPAGK